MATYTAPTTRASGYLVTAANWNTDIVENIKYFKDAPTFDGAVTASSTLTVANNVGLAATKKLYLDGVALTGDTYISESSANVLSLFSGNVEAKLTSGVLTVSGFGTHGFSSAGSTFNHLDIINTTSGTGAGTYLNLTSGTNTVYLQAQSQGYTTSGHVVQSGAVLQADGSGGLSIISAHASGAIRFYSGGTTERMTIQTNGYVGIGVTSSMGGKLSVTADPAVDVGFNFNATGTGSGTVGRFQSNGTSVGSITVTGSATSYNTTSDKRLKTDTGLSTDLSGLRALQIHDFTWIATGYKDRGLFAQDAYAHIQRGITMGGDANENPWSVDYSKFVPDLIVGWQQHDATIQSLAARIAALESK